MPPGLYHIWFCAGGFDEFSDTMREGIYNIFLRNKFSQW